MSQELPSVAAAEDLAWLAFRYVSRELTSEESNAFEVRLLTDQAACEAVAAAVHLIEDVRLVETLSDTRPVVAAEHVSVSRPATHAAARRSDLANWFMVAAAASLAGLAVWTSLRLAPRMPTGDRLPTDVASHRPLSSAERELALAWSDLQNSAAASLPASGSESLSGTEEETSTAEESSSHDGLSADASGADALSTLDSFATDDQRDESFAPAWMVSAIIMENNNKAKSGESAEPSVTVPKPAERM